jgi:aflatoxin B1 aldehyde reductase
VKLKITIAADHAKEVAAKHGINGHAAVLRWTTYHSVLNRAKGDAVIIGASSITQLATTRILLSKARCHKSW